MKKALIGFVAVVVLLLGGALIAPSFIDWNARLPEIAAGVKNATGRDLAVNGRLEVRILPTPLLTARGVKLGNAPGGFAPDMVALDAVEVRVALLPLLSGQVQVEHIRLVKPEIHIETYADGRTNLEFQSAPSEPTMAAEAAPATQETGAAASGLGLRLDNFEIVDAKLIYQDAQGKSERIENLTATLRAASLQGPFEAQGEARARGVPLAFEVSLGQIIAGRTIPINALLSAPGGTRAQIGGAVLEMETAPRFKGNIKVEGENLAALLGAVTGADGGPGLLRQGFGVQSAVTASAKDAVLSELELRLGDTRATGGVEVGLADGVTFQVDLNAVRIDADRLLAAGASSRLSGNGSGGGVAPKPPANGASGADAGFALPKNVNGAVALRVDAVTYKGGVVNDVRLNAELADGELALSQFQLQAPGVTDVALFGFVKPQDGQPRFTGDLELVTANPKGLAEWLGAQVPGGVTERLKRVIFKSKVSADPSQVALSAIDLVGDHTHVGGGVTVALRARPSFGADLRVDALNLDSYLNGNGALKKSPSTNATAAAEAPSQAEQAMDLLQVWARTAALNDFDANLALRVDKLTTGGRTLKGLAFDGTLYGGDLDLRQFKLGDLLGASATLSGHFNGFGAVPEMTGVKAQAKVKDANALASAFGVSGLPPKLGALALDLKADGSLLKPALRADLDALGGAFAAQGRLSLLPIGFGWDGEVAAKHADAAKLMAKAGYVPAGPLGALDISANLKSDGATHEVTNLKGSIGETNLAGQILAKTGAAKPNVVADLQTGVLDIQRFLAKSDKRAALTPPSNPLLVLASYGGGNQVAQAAPRADKRWSRETFDLSVLDTMNGELTLKSDAIRFGDYRLDNADIHATLNDGVMTADRVAGLLFGGPVSGRAVVRASGTPTLETDLKLDAMDVGHAIQAVTGKSLAAGKLGLDVNFASTGLSPAALVSSLNGGGSLQIDALDVKQGGTGTALAPVIGLVAAMNQFALPATGGAGGPKSGLADLALSFDLQDGVALAKNLSLNSAFGSGSGSGSVDIAAWAIDFAGTLTVEPNLLTTLLSKGQVGKQEVPFSLKGALDKPGVNLAVQPVGVAPSTGGAQNPVESILQQVLPGVIPQRQKTQPAPQPTPAPSGQGSTVLPPPPQQNQTPSTPQQQKLSPEEIFKRLMQGR